MYKRPYDTYKKAQRCRIKKALLECDTSEDETESLIEVNLNEHNDAIEYLSCCESEFQDELNENDNYNITKQSESDENDYSHDSDTSSVFSDDESNDDTEDEIDGHTGDAEDVEFDNILSAEANEKLYEGAPITVGESAMCIISLILSYNITGVLLSAFLKILEMHCIKPNKCLNTLYKFHKFFKNLKTPLKKHFLCMNCTSTVKSKETVCTNCNSNANVKYFIEIPIITQLKAFFKRPNFYEIVSNYRFNRKKLNNDNLEDIFDGLVYKKLKSEFLNSKNNITFTINTDGVPLFKASKFTIWPVYLMINELPYHLRIKKENIILAGLWFGAEKPNPILFISVFRNSLKKLYQGIYFKTFSNLFINVKAMIIAATLDLQAKALFLNMKLYSGYYGCHNCKIRGERVENVQVFPYEKNLEKRTTLETDQFAKLAEDYNTPVFGVKGRCILNQIIIDYIQAISIDVMHCVHINVIKKIMTLWFEPEYSNEDFSLRPYISEINKYLESIRVLDCISRTCRNLDSFSYWKASECKHFLLVYSLPVLQNFMKDVYFEHYFLLVYSIALLSDSSISEQMVTSASQSLNMFVKQFQILYGKKHMTMNIHLLLHLTDTVRNFGPLWTTSCYAFENMNGILKRFVHSSRKPELQIHSAISILVNLTNYRQKINQQNESTIGVVVDIFCKINESRMKRRKVQQFSDTVYIVGVRYVEKKILFLKRILSIEAADCQFNFYKRILKDKIMFETVSYSKNKKRNSSCVRYYVNNNYEIGLIKYFFKLCDNNCLCKLNCKNCNEDCKLYVVISKLNYEIAYAFNDNVLPTIFKCQIIEPENLIAIEAKNLKQSYFYITVSNFHYAVELSSYFECD